MNIELIFSKYGFGFMKWLFLLIFIFTIHNNFGQVNSDSKGLVAKGYDLVSYFQGVAQEGRPQFSYSAKGNTFLFSSDQNRQLFLKDPDKYLPQYGGWCAYAMGTSGKKVDIDPETFEIREGRLYLFYNRFFNNTYEDWLKEDPFKLRIKADDNWERLINSGK